MSWLSAFGGFVGKVIGAGVSGDSSAPVATLGKTTITFGEAKAALQGAPALVSALEHIVAGQGTLADAETVGGDILAGAGIVAPEYAPLIEVAGAVALTLGPMIVAEIASGQIKGDADPIHDAQTTDTPHSGRRA